jgi:hypothetical protein
MVTQSLAIDKCSQILRARFYRLICFMFMLSLFLLLFLMTIYIDPNIIYVILCSNNNDNTVIVIVLRQKTKRSFLPQLIRKLKSFKEM